MIPEHISPYTPIPDSPQAAIKQIDQSLTLFQALSKAQNEVTAKHHSGIHVWLQAHARAVEAAMRFLRVYPGVTESVGVELTQSLTVLILVADMIVNELLQGPEGYDLLQRNAERASMNLQLLRPLLERS
jgi:hypothetical protein